MNYKEERNKEDLKLLTEYFNSLEIQDWKITGNIGEGGQAKIIEVRNTNTGELGIFRTLKRKKQTDIDRFNREILIVKNIDHPNIMKVLAYSLDEKHQWYISKKGKVFKTYWDSFINSRPSQNQILDEAVKILKCLTEGLIELHKKGIVHRDIKAPNIIMNNDIAVLIDFGIAFVTGEERLTPIDGAVANKFSPDPALNFMENVPPWLDVFLLSQLFIWMVGDQTNKPHIQRPLDWRWVVYPALSDENIVKAKAFTSICSNYFTSPQNATELKVLLDKLFDKNQYDMSDELADKVARIKDVIQRNASSQIISFSETHSIIESRLPLFVKICIDLEVAVKSMLDKLDKYFRVTYTNGSVTGFAQRFQNIKLENNLEDVYTDSLYYHVAIENHSLQFLIQYLLNTKQENFTNPELPKSLYTPYIKIHINNGDTRILSKSKYISIIPDETGTLIMHDKFVVPPPVHKEVTIAEIVDMIERSLTDQSVWQLLSR